MDLSKFSQSILESLNFENSSGNINQSSHRILLMNISYLLDGVIFEWDSNKADLVFREHQVSFEECASVLLNTSTITKEDYRDYGEQRFISTGYSHQARILTVVWTPKENSVRLITGFKATKQQSKEFHNG